MMQPFEIIKTIEKIAPLKLAAPWDKSGVQVAAFIKNIQHIAVMLDPTLESLKKALELGAEFMLAHHPLSMKPRFPDSPGAYHRILSLLFSNDICLYSAHTSLDSSPLGPACWLAKELGIPYYTPLEVTGELDGHPAGFGFIGDLPKTENYNDFCLKLAKVLERDSWRACGPEVSGVGRVACCPGSGAELAGEAIAQGADIYITGDLKYHAALDAEIRILDVGHFQIEEIMMRNFAQQLSKELPGLKISFIASGDPLIFEKH